MADPENVSSLADYQPENKKHVVSLSFSGGAATAISELMTTLQVPNANEVAKRAIALLLSAQGKEIILRNPKTGETQTVEP